ncbi:immunoglobulin lambda-1 light chain-like [Festucalex cinctus]
MFLLLLSIAASFTRLSGLDVTQTPADIIDSVGRSATVDCSHNIDVYNLILWYRQRGMDMQLIGYLHYKTVTMELGQEDVEIKGGAQAHETCKMIIPKLRLNSSAIYYCVASPHGAAWYEIINGGKIIIAGGVHVPDSCTCGSTFDKAFFGAGTRLTVLEPGAKITPPKVTLFPPSDHECTNDKDKTKKKTLVCAATDFYPDHVRVAWTVDGEKRERGVATDPEARRRGATYSITSRLRVPAREWSSGSRKFTCIVTFFDGETYGDYPHDIHGQDGSGEDGQSRESFLRLAQSGKLSYGVLIVKSCVYAAFVAFLLWRLRVSPGKNH